MFKKLNRIMKSISFTKSHLVRDLELYGQSINYINESFYGSNEWKSSFNSYKIVIENVIDDKVAYRSWYIDPEGNEYIIGQLKITNVNHIVKLVRSLKLMVRVNE